MIKLKKPVNVICTNTVNRHNFKYVGILEKSVDAIQEDLKDLSFTPIQKLFVSSSVALKPIQKVLVSSPDRDINKGFGSPDKAFTDLDLSDTMIMGNLDKITIVPVENMDKGKAKLGKRIEILDSDTIGDLDSTQLTIYLKNAIDNFSDTSKPCYMGFKGARASKMACHSRDLIANNPIKIPDRVTLTLLLEKASAMGREEYKLAQKPTDLKKSDPPKKKSQNLLNIFKSQLIKNKEKLKD